MVQDKHINRFRLVASARGLRIRVETGSDDDLLRRLFGQAPEAVRPFNGQLPMAVAEIMVLARRSGLEVEPKGLLSDPVLVLSEAPSKSTPAGVLSPFKDLHGIYAAHWSIIDFYPEHEQALREALASGEPMDTLAFGAKKETQFARIRREAASGPVSVQVRCEADDGIALADTAFWSAAGGNSAGDCGLDVLFRMGLSKVQAVRELEHLADQAGIGETNEAIRNTDLQPAASYDEVVQALERLTDECEEELHARAAAMTELARQRLGAIKSGGAA